MITRQPGSWPRLFTASTFLSIYHQPVGWLPGIALTGLALVAAFNPYNALLVIAALGPLSATILRAVADFADWGSTSAKPWSSLPCRLGGATGRAGSASRGSEAVPVGGGTAPALALASGVVDATVIRTEQPDRTLADLTQDFFTPGLLPQVNTIRSTMLFLEGIALMVMAADTYGGDRSSPRSAVANDGRGRRDGRFFNVIKILTSAMLQPDTCVAFFRYLATARVNIHFPDLNAAGSYFALMLFVAIGFVPRCADSQPTWLRHDCRRAVDRRTGRHLCRVRGTRPVPVSCIAPSRRSEGAGISRWPRGGGCRARGWKLYPQGRNRHLDEAICVSHHHGKTAIE